jgi:uncharacterized protein (DUF58 family)
MTRQLYILRASRYLWLFKLTPAGRVLVISILLTALGSVTVEIPIYQLFCGLLGLLAVSETIGMLLKPSLDLSGALPLRSTAGGDVLTRVTVRNRSSWRPALDVMLHLFRLHRAIEHVDDHSCVPLLAPGASAVLPLTLRTPRRGIFPLPPLQAVSTFPLHLMRFGGAQSQPGRLVVFPTFQSLEEFDVPVSHRYQPGGVMLTRGLGHSPEYVGNREYVSGEPAHRIDAKAWARTGKPIVKEYHEEYCSRIALVLDTHLPRRGLMHPPNQRRLEAAVSLTAAIAERLNFHEHVIDLFAAGPELYVFRTQGGTTRFDSVLEILAGVDACRRNPFEQISPLIVEELEAISTAVCLFVDWDATRADFARRVLESGCMLKGILIRGDEDEPAIPEGEFEGDWTFVTAAEIERGQVLRL